MPRSPRLVVPGYPHHVTQRGGRKQRTFFRQADYLTYLELLRELKDEARVTIWAYCLMPNHVHFVMVPQDKQSLANLFRPLHSRYALGVNGFRGWRGHLWQERFYSVVMNESHTFAAMRYVELNPVRAGLCAKPEDWRWSSIHAHLNQSKGDIVDVLATQDLVNDWREYLQSYDGSVTYDDIRKQTRSGRPEGDRSFIDHVEAMTGRRVRRKPPGRSKGQ
ncbi:MAG: transposase [Proteobacteria bacterium]|nr:transposase [Pseudomonadota bacterium]